MKNMIALTSFALSVACGDIYKDSAIEMTTENQESLSMSACVQTLECSGETNVEGKCQTNAFDGDPCAQELFDAAACIVTHGTCDEDGFGVEAEHGWCAPLSLAAAACQQQQQ